MFRTTAATALTAFFLAGCGAAGTPANQAASSPAPAGSQPLSSGVPASACAQAVASLRGVAAEARPYVHVRTTRDLAAAATKVSHSSVAGESADEVLAPVQTARATAGSDSVLGTDLTNLTSIFSALGTNLASGGPAEIRSDAQGVMTDVAIITRVCT
jgi:hypothetical protein